MSLKEQMEEMGQNLADIQEALNQKKPKKFRSIRTKLGKKKMKRGYIVVVEIGENKSVNIRKEPVVDGTVKLSDTLHAVSDLDIFLYQPILGKSIPMIFQPKVRLNPWNPLRDHVEGENETYGQKYVMARMEGDKLSLKKPTSIITWILVLAAVGAGIYVVATGGFS
jgi:hypothetical protein